jgi:ATP-dependent DNA helicase RecQ
LPTQAALSPEDAAIIVEAVGELRRPVGKTNLARALRGSRARPLSRLGLLQLPQHGRLRAADERAIVAGIEALLAAGRLVRKGVKYPTVWLPGRPVRPVKSVQADGAAPGEARPAGRWKRSFPVYNDCVRLLENYRRRMARQLRWKPYMVFQTRTIVALDAERPVTLAELARIPGLGPARVERFGRDLIELMKQQRSKE